MDFGYVTKQNMLICLVPKFLLYHFFSGFNPSTARLSTQVSCLAQTLRLTSRDHLTDLACSGELESVAGGRG